MSTFVWRSGRNTKADPRLVGGKAANLDRLIREGFHVPPFYVVTTQAFAQAGRMIDAILNKEFPLATTPRGGSVVA